MNISSMNATTLMPPIPTLLLPVEADADADTATPESPAPTNPDLAKVASYLSAPARAEVLGWPQWRQDRFLAVAARLAGRKYPTPLAAAWALLTAREQEARRPRPEAKPAARPEAKPKASPEAPKYEIVAVTWSTERYFQVQRNGTPVLDFARRFQAERWIAQNAPSCDGHEPPAGRKAALSC